MRPAPGIKPPDNNSTRLDWIRWAMRKGDWWTFEGLQQYLPMHCQETTISARIRDLRREGFVIESRRLRGGLHQYRMVIQSPADQGSLF